MDEGLNGAVRLPAEPSQLSRGALGERRDVLAWPRAGNGDVARLVPVPSMGAQHEQGARVVGDWALDDPSLALSRDQQRCLPVATTER